MSISSAKANGLRDLFMNLLSTVVLYMSIVSFITLMFAYLDVMFPDILHFSYDSNFGQVRWSGAMLSVAFPAYLILHWLFEKDFRLNPERKDTGIRKFFVNLTFFIAAVTIIIDLITLLYNFWGGELTIRFVLKTLVVLLVAMGVFGYYFWDNRRKGGEKIRTARIILSAVALLVVASIITGFFIVGSPETQRQRRLDEQRVQNLQMLQGEIVNYWAQKNVLPQNLDELTNTISGFVPPKDPVTNAPYEYRVKDSLVFELCASFTETSIGNNSKTAPMPLRPGYYDPYRQNWAHEKGRACFERTIDPRLYKREPIKTPY